jgi:uncharacterized protein YndB with AHSA1/START domain
MIDEVNGYSGEALYLERIFDASPERVFAAWTEPQLLKRWWGPVGSTIVAAEVDLRVGGRYRLGIQQPSAPEPYFVSGAYQVIEPPHKLVFTWRWENPAMDIGDSLVSLEFRPKGKKTQLQLTHERLPTPETRLRHQEGWLSILENLSSFLQTEHSLA